MECNWQNIEKIELTLQMFTGIHKVIVSCFCNIYEKGHLLCRYRYISPKGPKIVERSLWTLPDAFWTYFFHSSIWSEILTFTS